MSSFRRAIDRAAAAAEEAFKKRVQTSMPPDSTTVVVFTDPETEEAPKINDGLYIVRVLSEGGHHSHLLDPRTADTVQEFRRRVLQLPQATLEADNEFASQLTNLSIWKAFVVGEKKNMFSLVSHHRQSSIALNLKEDGSIAKLMKNGKKSKLSEFPRTPGQNVVATYSSDKKADLQKPIYKNFVAELEKRLSESNFLSSKINLNSLTRTPSSQARAMVGTRFLGPKNRTLEFFEAWVERTYGDVEMRNEILEVTKTKRDWASQKELIDALTPVIQGQVDRGLYISKHLQSGAADLKTNNLSYEDVKVLLDVLLSMKEDGIVSYYNWEGVSDLFPNNPSKGENKRKLEGVFDDNEHVHLQLNKNLKIGE